MSTFCVKQRASWGHLVRIVSCAGLMTLLPEMAALAQQASATPRAAGTSAGDAATTAASTAPADQTSQTGQLQEVTVTAQRVRENMQRVPIAVNAATGIQLQQAGVTDIQSLATLVPNIINTGSTTNFTYIRGVGSSNGSLNNEAAVSTYVDGVYMANPYGQFGNFNNVSRIEVLKGPQGTLFGRDTTGGVIQIITPDPSHTLSGNLEESYGNYNTIGGKGYVTGGISNTVAADLAVVYEDQRSGFGTDLCPNQVGNSCSAPEPLGKEQDLATRTKLLWAPADGTKVVAEGDYELYRSNFALQLVPGSIDGLDKDLPAGSPINPVTYPGRFNAYGQPYELRAEQYGGSLHVDQDITDWLHFVSITSYRQLAGYEIHDNTRTPDNALYTIAENSHGNFETQEFQLIDQNPGRVTWLVGAYYFGDTVGYDPRTQTGSLVSKGFIDISAAQTIRSYSVYGQETTQIFDPTKLELSARYTDESVNLDGQYQNAAGQIVTPSNSTVGAAPYDEPLKYNPWTYRAALDQQFSQDVMGYLSFTHGFKSGGFNLPTPERAPFLPEQIDSYEVGAKSEFMDHRVRLNLALYYYNYQDIQVTISPGLNSQLFTNAGAAHANGVDADLAFAETENLTWRVALGYIHGYFTDYPNAQRYTSAGVAVPIPNAAGYPLPYAPRYSASIGLNYTIPASIGDFIFAPTVAYTDPYAFTTDTNFVVPRTVMVNATLEWAPRALKGFSVQLWGKNLANEYYYGGGPVESTGGWYAIPSPPRMYGVTLRQTF